MQFEPQQPNPFEPEQRYLYEQQPLSSPELPREPVQQPEGSWQSVPQQPMPPQQMPQQAYYPSAFPQQQGQQQPQQPLQNNPMQQMYMPQAQYPLQQWQQPLQPLQNNPMQPPMYAPQMQQPGYPYQGVQPVIMMPQQVVNVNIQNRQHGLFVRALYFFFIGWWAGLIWLNIGYFFVMSIIGLPVGLMMLNRLPMVMTLKPANQSININIVGNTTNINISGTQQINFLIRALYFVFVGWWAGLVWSYVAYGLFVLVLTIPVGVIMFNMLPTIITLRKN